MKKHEESKSTNLPESKSFKVIRMGSGGPKYDRCKSIKGDEQYYGPTHIHVCRETKEPLLLGANLGNGFLDCRGSRTNGCWII